MKERRDTKGCNKTDWIRSVLWTSSVESFSYSLNLVQFLKEWVLEKKKFVYNFYKQIGRRMRQRKKSRGKKELLSQ